MEKQDNQSLENKIAERFNSLADIFPDSVSLTDKRVKAILGFFDNVASKKVLDVGCGKGRFSKVLIDKGAAVAGVEPSEKLLDEAKKIAKGIFVKGSATQLPFPDESFDCVFAIEVLGHIPEPAKAVREMTRVLKPGGKIVIIDRNKFSFLRTFWKKYREIKNRWMYPKGFSFQEKLFCIWEIEGWLSAYCDDVQIEYLGEYVEETRTLSGKLTYLSDVLSKFFPILSYNMAWLGKKK